MKVLLCQTYTGPKASLVFPIGLAYIASALNSNHELFCWDPNVSSNPVAELSAILEKFKPDLIGISFRNIDSVICSMHVPPRSYYKEFVSFVKLIKEKAPSAKLVVGGPGFSIFSEDIMARNPEIDYGIVSEGERAFLQLIEHLDNPEDVKNLVFRSKQGIVKTENDGYMDFSALAPPSRESFDLGEYGKYPFSMGIQSKRGCPFGCFYCVNPCFVGSSLRIRRPEAVVDEIEELVDTSDIREFYFADPVFNYPPEHARDICQEIVRRRLDITWQADFRPDFVNFRLMSEAVDSGCVGFNFSPDGASNEAMRLLGKNMTVECVLKTAMWASQIENSSVNYSFMYDLPSYNREHMIGLMKLSSKIMAACRRRVKSFGLTRMRIYPNTRLHALAVKQGKIQADTDLIFPFYYTFAGEKIAHSISSLACGYSEILRKIMSINLK